MNSKLIFIFTLIFVSSCATKKPVPQAPTISKEKQVSCMKRMQFYKVLASLSDNSKYFKLINSTDLKTLCSKNYDSTMAFMDNHKGKIGVIIEDNKEQINKSKAIIEGIKESLGAVKHIKKGSFIVKRVPLRKKKVNTIFSNMILNDKVGLVITWGQKRFIDHIQRWQKNLKIPAIFISNKIKKSAESFHIFPDRKNYSIEMIKTLKKRGIKRIAILTPKSYRKTPILRTIKHYMKKYGIEIVHDVEYVKNSYDSYDMACRSIFTIDRYKRRGEYNAILRHERRKAKNEGFQLNRKLVFLPALVNFDAVFIPDDFKTVHYFTKLFKYYQAKNVQLIGTYQWRSNDLLRPKESMLNGAAFVDFLGDYKKLPIKVKEAKDDDMHVGLRTDYKLMGYYTGLLGQKVLKSSNNSKNKVKEALKSVRVKDKFVGKTKAFKNNRFRWPSFTIEVRNNQFVVNEK